MKNQFNTTPTYINCKQCGINFRISPSRMNYTIFCNRACRSKNAKGKPFYGVKHGLANKVKAYGVWKGMRKRCNNVNELAYKDYGGRGITVCTEWNEFEVFYKDMGDPPEGKSLDRIDNDLGYYKNNCRWASRKEQANNRRPRKHASSSKTTTNS